MILHIVTLFVGYSRIVVDRIDVDWRVSRRQRHSSVARSDTRFAALLVTVIRMASIIDPNYHVMLRKPSTVNIWWTEPGPDETVYDRWNRKLADATARMKGCSV